MLDLVKRPNLNICYLGCAALLFNSSFVSAQPSVQTANNSNALTETVVPQLSALVTQAKSLTLSRDYQGVITLLAPFESNFGGNANYDYYLGTAFLELGQYGDAIFALERAIENGKNFAGARFELARAYFHNKEYPVARKLFESLLTMQPPKNLVDTISSYLRAISARENAYKRVHKPAVSFSIGFDNNANNAPDIETFQGVFLADKNIEKSSTYYALHLSDLYSMPVLPDWRWQSQGSAYLRNNPSANFVDMQLLVLQTGLNWSVDNQNLSLDIGGIHSNIEGEALGSSIPESLASDYQTENLQRNGGFLNFRFSHKTAAQSNLSFNSKIAKYRHEPILKLRDMTQYSFNFGYQFNLSNTWQLNSQLIMVKDDVELSSSPYGNNRYGVDLTLAHPIYSTLLSTMNIKYFNVDYDGLFSGQDRSDSQLSLNYSLNWLFNHQLNYWAKLSWFDNQSEKTLDIYSYRKSAIEMGVSYQF